MKVTAGPEATAPGAPAGNAPSASWPLTSWPVPLKILASSPAPSRASAGDVIKVEVRSGGARTKAPSLSLVVAQPVIRSATARKAGGEKYRMDIIVFLGVLSRRARDYRSGRRQEASVGRLRALTHALVDFIPCRIR